MSDETLPGREKCPGNLQWSAFGATYMDTVCASALTFREGEIPCPFCDPDGFIEYQWHVGDGETVILWEHDEQAVHPDTEIHFHDGQALWWTATHPERGEERVLFRSIIDRWDLADALEQTTARLREAEAVIAKVRKRVAVLGETFEGLQQMPTSNLNGFAADLATYKPTNQEGA